jgi:hypothetical protein
MPENRAEVLVLLNKYFKTAALERYPEVMVQTYMDRAWQSVCGPNYKKQRLRLRDIKRIKSHILKELRVNYGKWISIISSPKDFKFSTNFEFVYKTEFGRLYANPPKSDFGHLYFTTHALQQFDSRIDQDKIKDYNLAFKQAYGELPTAADILCFFIMLSFQFGVKDNFIYFNVNYGILVAEVLSPECVILKTFLTPDMIVDPGTRWYIVKPGNTHAYLEIPTVLQDPESITDPIDILAYYLPQYDYEFFANVMIKGLI